MSRFFKIFIIIVTIQLALVAGLFNQSLHKYSYITISGIEDKSGILDALSVFDVVLGRKDSMSEGYRPIVIKEVSWFDPQNLGFAVITPYGCVVLLNDKMNKTTQSYRSVVIHEILHCLGYMHHPNPNDIMFWANMNDDEQFLSSYWYLTEIRGNRFPSKIEESR